MERTQKSSATKRGLNLVVTLTILLIMLTGATLTVHATPVDITNDFKDANFLAAVRQIIGKADEPIYDDDVINIANINVSNKNIADLSGIEHFTALTMLSCSNNQLTELNVKKNIELTQLYCQNNKLTEIDVSNNTKLTRLNCSNNQIAELDVLKHTALIQLNCSANQLTKLDVANNIELTRLDCSNNQLTELDVSNNTKLAGTYYGIDITERGVSINMDFGLNCSRNQLTELDVSKNTALTVLWCHTNQLTELDVSNNTALIMLDCQNNQLAEFDVSKNTALTYLNFYNNQLTELDVSVNTALLYFNCANNQLTELNVKKNTALKWLDCFNNQLVAGFNNQLTELDVSANAELIGLYCYNNQLTALNVSQNTALTQFNCLGNQLTRLDVSANTKLIWLNCSYNNMTGSSDVIGWEKSPGLDLGTTFIFDLQNTKNPILDDIFDNAEDKKYDVVPDEDDENVKYIKGITINDTVESLGFATDVTVLDRNNKEIKSGSLATGMVIKKDGEVIAVIVIKGDVTGDGNPGINDAQTLLEHLVGNNPLGGAYEKAADDFVNEDSAIKSLRAFLNFVMNN